MILNVCIYINNWIEMNGRHPINIGFKVNVFVNLGIARFVKFDGYSCCYTHTSINLISTTIIQ
jgi:hypothetical protein